MVVPFSAEPKIDTLLLLIGDIVALPIPTNAAKKSFFFFF